MYNKGIPLSKLQEYSENTAFIEALKFTGKHAIINDIINPEQLLKLQKTWLLKNVYFIKDWSEKCLKFIETTDWAADYLKENGFSEQDIEQQYEKLSLSEVNA
ncbi:hypothetical protein MG296_10680 [Flavobacteriaceae bacterium TK19130]|nr:hypothetical protein [Thermobacterium salinum]